MRQSALGGLFCIIALPATALGADQGSLNGWCIEGSDCTGEVAFLDDTFNTCESTCRLLKATRGSGISGNYVAVCQSDSGESSHSAYIQQFEGDRKEGVFVTPWEAQKLYICDN